MECFSAQWSPAVIGMCCVRLLTLAAVPLFHPPREVHRVLVRTGYRLQATGYSEYTDETLELIPRNLILNHFPSPSSSTLHVVADNPIASRHSQARQQLPESKGRQLGGAWSLAEEAQ